MATRDLHLLTARADAEHPFGVAVLDRYVEFVSARCRPNTVAATVSDLGVFFSVIDKDPLAVCQTVSTSSLIAPTAGLFRQRE